MNKDKNRVPEPGWPELDQMVLDEIMALKKEGSRDSASTAALCDRHAERKTGKKVLPDLACLSGQRIRPLARPAGQTTVDPVAAESSIAEEPKLPDNGLSANSDAVIQPVTALFSTEEERFLDQTLARLDALGNVDMLMAELWRRVTASGDEAFYQPPTSEAADDANGGGEDEVDE